MMPTFPPPPLKFRTAGFPPYGFKASLSANACPNGGRVKRAPHIPRQAFGLRPPSRPPADVIHWTPVPSPEGQSGGIFTAGCAADPSPPTGGLAPIRVLLSRSILADSDPIHQSRRHPETSRFCRSYPGPSLCGSAEATHETFPPFPGVLSARAADLPPVGPLAPPVTSGTTVPGSLAFRTSRHPQPRLCQQCLTGVPFGAAPFASGCGPGVCPALLAGYDGCARALPPAEVPCHSRFWHWPSPGSAGSQARWANGKSPIVGTCTRLVATGSEAAP